MDIVKAKQAAKLMAIGMYTELQTREPVFNEVISKSKRPHDDWDFFYSVAVVGLLIMGSKAGEEEISKFHNQLLEDDSEFVAGLDNFLKYMDDYPPTKDEAAFRYLIGQFVLWNVANEEPKYEHVGKLCNMVGFLVIRNARDLNVM